jgi:SAM-dependent methyltransferase
MTTADRLRALAVDTELAGLDMAGERQRFAALARRHTDGTAPSVVTGFNLFQTPATVAALMAALLPSDACRILEPSAGLGRLYLAGRDRCPAAQWVLVDENRDCIKELYRVTEGQGRGVVLKEADFLTLTADDMGGAFDAVIMNPPFERGRDVRHISHAAAMLKPGGLLVGLCYDGATQDRLLRPRVETWEPLPAGSFRSEGTSAGVVMVTMRKGGTK